MGYLCNFDMILKSLYWGYLYISNVGERFCQIICEQVLNFPIILIASLPSPLISTYCM